MSYEMTPTCACCAPALLPSGQGLNRRGFLNFGAAGVAGTALATLSAGKSMAASGHYEAMLVNCIDPRFTTISWHILGLIQGLSREKMEVN
jgi:hypothetical protein